MNLNILKIFYAVAKEGSITKAAVKLNYVQSNVSARIKQLEEELNVPLFYRTGKRIILTPAGRTLLLFAEKIINIEKEAEKAVEEASGGYADIAVGFIETAASVRLPAILTGYNKNFPGVVLNVATGSTEELLLKVLNYELDGAFVGGPIKHPDIEEHSVFEEELVIFSNEYLADPSDLTDKNIIVFKKRCAYRRRLEEFCRSRGILFQKVFEFDSLEAILACVSSGMGITMLPRSVVKEMSGTNLKIIPLSNDDGKMTTVFIKRKDTITTKALFNFLKFAEGLNK